MKDNPDIAERPGWLTRNSKLSKLIWELFEETEAVSARDPKELALMLVSRIPDEELREALFEAVVVHLEEAWEVG